MIVSWERVPLTDEHVALDLFKKLLNKIDPIARDREHFWVICLDTRNYVRFIELVSIGTVDNCLAHPREVFRRAIVNRGPSDKACQVRCSQKSIFDSVFCSFARNSFAAQWQDEIPLPQPVRFAAPR